jgi:hypothetical protein
MWSTLFRFGIPPFLYLGFNTSVVKVCQYHECMVLGISPDTFWSALGSSVVVLNLYVIQKWNELSTFMLISRS